MPSRINENVPAYGKASTQSVRDNFAIAKQEITDLQALRWVEDVPSIPTGESYVRQRGMWVVLTTNVNVDGGTF